VRFYGHAFSLELGGARISGVMADAHHLLLEGPCVVEDHGDGRLCVRANRERTLVGVRGVFDPGWLDRPPPFLPQVAVAGLSVASAGLTRDGCAALEKALSVMRGQVYSPQGRIRHRWTTPDRWPHRDMWLWDSAFHAIGWRHIDPGMARDALSAVLDCQDADGFVAHQARPDWQSELTQPPVLAYAVELVNRVVPDHAWVQELYPKLVSYLRWDQENRDRDGAGLVEWEISEFEHCRSGESGCDNSPRFDEGRLLDAPDFNAYLANDLDSLARLAPLAGRPEDAPRWRAAADRLRTLINRRLWDEEDGFYFDLDPATGSLKKVWASSGFMPLLCGAPDAAMAQRLVAHLYDDGPFDTALPVASVSPRDPAYRPDMWRGPSWVNHSWLIAEGLDRYGYRAAARRIRDRWCEVLVRDHGRYGTFFEYYDGEDRVPPVALLRKGANKPQFPHQAIRDYGWTATLFVDWCCRAAVAPRSGGTHGPG
jgi:hypothetical protein